VTLCHQRCHTVGVPRLSAAEPVTRSESFRLERAERREVLLNAAAEMVADGLVDEISMESVALRAHVSRGLVYKHFSNRHDLLSALYQRESTRLHDELASDVLSASGLRAMLGVLIRGALRAQQTRGATFAALSAEGSRDGTHQITRRRRDGQTLQFFTRQAMSEYQLSEPVARGAMAMTLGSIPNVLAQWRHSPSPRHAEQLEAVYVDMAIGGLERLSKRN